MSDNRKFLVILSVLIITWSVIIGNHEHDIIQTTKLSDLPPQREIFLELTNNSIDLENINIQANEIIDLLIKDLRSVQHTFIFTGTRGVQYDILSFENSTYRIRLKAPSKGNMLFYCVIPGHEDIHGVIQIQSTKK